MPQRASSFGTANTGPMPISSGSQPALFRELGAHQQAGGGAIGQLAGIARRDVAALADRLEARKALEGGVGPVALVALEGDLLEALRLGDLVDPLLGGRHRTA